MPRQTKVSVRSPSTAGVSVILVILCVSILVLQLLVLRFGTYTQRFSVQAYIMNAALVVSIYLTLNTCNPCWLLLPFVLRIGFVVNYVLFGNLHKHLTTEYLYSDFFENVTTGNKCSEYYTEGDYSGMVPFDTLDHSDANVRSAMRWGLSQYLSYANRPSVQTPSKFLTGRTMQQSQINKYAWIVRHLDITRQSRVLELGFGKLDLMLYIRQATGATVEGTNLSMEQIHRARANGFTCYAINHLDLHKYTKQLGAYDVIITNGTLEYIVDNDDGDGNGAYNRFVQQAIYPLLKTGGYWYTTTIHINNPIKNRNITTGFIQKTLNRTRNLYNLYMLAAGNEGRYPDAPSQLTSVAEKNGLVTRLQQDRTMDYFLAL